MSFDRDALAALTAEYGAVARVVVATVGGSAPREVGASMVVWPTGQQGTIGGGALELEAVERARGALVVDADRYDSVALGPAVQQCCGGRVGLLTEIWTEERLRGAAGEVVARPLPGRPAMEPLAVRRIVQSNRGAGQRPSPLLIDGWFVEPVTQPNRMLWVYGAGHVGRAIVAVTAPLPGVAVTWVDTGRNRFPDDVPPNVTPLVAANPADAVRHAPPEAEHLILTYSHAFDLEICHRLLAQVFRSAGLIGSATKWARFRSRLAALGHGPDQIARITCPIGDPSLGKHPQAIAVGVAAEFQRTQTLTARAKGETA